MEQQRIIKCPVCRKQVETQPPGESFPFCSGRCKAVDLHRWFNGEYAVDPGSGDLDVIDPDEAEDVTDDFKVH